jgi:hypothetical protein
MHRLEPDGHYDGSMTFRKWSEWVSDSKNWRKAQPESVKLVAPIQKEKYRFASRIVSGDTVEVILQSSKDGIEWNYMPGYSRILPLNTGTHLVQFTLFDKDVACQVHTGGQPVQPKPEEPVDTKATVEQPKPQGKGYPVYLDVIKDISERVRVGIERYGEPLKPNNGREALVDAYQEAIDLVMYLRQRVTEEEQGLSYTKQLQNDVLNYSNRIRELNEKVLHLERLGESKDASINDAIAKLNKLNRSVEDGVLLTKDEAYGLAWHLVHLATGNGFRNTKDESIARFRPAAGWRVTFNQPLTEEFISLMRKLVDEQG